MMKKIELPVFLLFTMLNLFCTSKNTPQSEPVPEYEKYFIDVGENIFPSETFRTSIKKMSECGFYPKDNVYKYYKDTIESKNLKALNDSTHLISAVWSIVLYKNTDARIDSSTIIFSEYQIEKDKFKTYLERENINKMDFWSQYLGMIFAGSYKFKYFWTDTGIYYASIKDKKYDLDHTTLSLLHDKYSESTPE